MNAILVVSAAIAYSIGGYFMKESEGITRIGPTAIVLLLFCLGASLQMIAMRHQEMSTLYIIVLGLEAIGAFSLGVLLLGETPSLPKILGALIVCAGVALLRQ